ncbi:MAG: sugar phosphate isomerase/epimerase, partial [Saprospiraceae bacterium]|nr:sugar phosphate isomerase/epimerase [Saprospiraceae bacterium]
EKILKYQDRLYDIHLKDVDAETAEGKSVEFGRGIIDLPSVLKTLAEIRYDGIMAIEFEKDEQSPVPGLAECVGYANGIMDALAI